MVVTAAVAEALAVRVVVVVAEAAAVEAVVVEAAADAARRCRLSPRIGGLD